MITFEAWFSKNNNNKNLNSEYQEYCSLMEVIEQDALTFKEFCQETFECSVNNVN